MSVNWLWKDKMGSLTYQYGNREPYQVNVYMRGVANCPPELLYKRFGINAELLIDHSWGRESCTMKDIKSYKSKSKSIIGCDLFFHIHS